MTAKLRLGPIPRQETVKLTIAISAQLKGDLTRYAKLHAQIWGQEIEVHTLIPHILEAFIARDRVFRRSTREVLTNT
jgi:hypothetical protein